MERVFKGGESLTFMVGFENPAKTPPKDAVKPRCANNLDGVKWRIPTAQGILHGSAHDYGDVVESGQRCCVTISN